MHLEIAGDHGSHWLFSSGMQITMNVGKTLLTSFLLAALLPGCTEQPPETPPDTDEETPAAIPADPNVPSEPAVTLERPQLPADVFFEDPLSVAANRSRIPGAGPSADDAAMTATSNVKPDAASPMEAESPKSVDWAAILPADLLVAEVTRIRERFEPKLSSVANFNNSLLDFPPYAAELAALGGIATEHSGNIPWKENAKFVRDLASEMLSDQLQRGQKSYEQVNVPFGKVATLLDGKRPDDLPESDDATDFAMVADFGYLMRRFEAGQNAMQTIGSSEPAFKENSADLAREARVIAALSRVFALDDYGYGEDPEFQKFATTMTESALATAAAAEKGDFKAFDESLNALGQSCVQCHGEYRNN